MTSSAQALLQQPAAALPGCWKLAAGRAVTLLPSQPGALQIAHGRVWATLDGPRDGLPRGGDLFLESGDRLELRAGERVVFEPWGGSGDSPAYFCWQPLPEAQDSRWSARVVQPLADLRLALASAGFAARGVVGAVLRLGVGLSRFAIDLVAGRDRWVRA